MSYFTSLVTRGQEKATSIRSITSNTTSKIVDSAAVKVAIRLGDRALVNTVGITAALVAPAATSVWNKLKTLSEAAPVAAKK